MVDRARFLALFSAVMLPMFMAAVDQTLLATATPVIAHELGALADTSWIAVGYLLAATVMAPVYGRAGDRLGRRNVLLAALAVFAMGSLACGLAQSMHTLIAARVLQGLGGGGLMVTSQALIGELVPPRERPRFQGYFAIVFTASSVGGPVLGGFVVNHASWRWLFFANLPLCLLAAWRVAKLPRPAPGSTSRDAPLDPMGLVLFVIAAVATLLWLSLAGHRFALLSPVSGVLLVLALGGAFALWRQQRRRAHPFLPLDVLRLPGVPAVCATVACFAAAMFALVFLLPIYLQLGLHASAASAGLQLLPLTGGLVLGAVINGRYTARAGMVGRTPPWGLGAAALAMAGLALLPPSAAATTVAAAVCGLGFGTVMPNAQLSVQLIGGRARLGASAALLALSRSAGASFGTAAFGGLAFALMHMGPGPKGGAVGALSAAASAQAVLNGTRAVFGVLAVWLVLGGWFAWRAPRLMLSEQREEDVEAVAPV